tara:strand:+ start:42 stop:674 length:633 start_codon:yes stop_codon:yes gene_type:complete
MNLKQFAERYGLNTRAVNGLYDLKKRADRGEFPHDSDPRVRRYFDNNIEKALIIAVKAEIKREKYGGRFPMLWRCGRIGRKTITNIMEAVYAYLDDPNTPETIEELRVDTPMESKPDNVKRVKRGDLPSINYIHFDMDLYQYCTPNTCESTKSLTFSVTSHTNKKYVNSHCAIILEKDMGDDEVIIVEELPISQLKRLQKFIEMALELDK